MSDIAMVVRERWLCLHCQRTFASRSYAAKHADNCHRNQASRACSTCTHFVRQPCCDIPSDDCGCGGLNECKAGAFETWRYSDHKTREPDPSGWWRHVVDFRRDCPSWEAVW